MVVQDEADIGAEVTVGDILAEENPVAVALEATANDSDVGG